VATSVQQLLTVNKASAAVTLGSLSQTYDGTAESATATTIPDGLAVTLTYNCLTTPPTNVGSYSVVGTINDPNYQGSTSGTLTINMANQTITFGALPMETFGYADFALGATASSGLPISYTSSDTTVATIVAGNIHIVSVGSCTITASQSGDANYTAAVDVQHPLTVNTTGGGGSNTPPAFLTPPTMSPDAGSITAGEPVAFTAAATDAADDFIAYSWNFGDGTYGSGANPTHTYTSAGLYPVTVTASNGVASATFTLYVGVNSLDGTGTNPDKFQVQKAAITFKFKTNEPNSDSMTLTGTLPMLSGLIPKGQALTVIVGDYESDFKLSAKGTATSIGGTDSIKLIGGLKNGVFSTGQVKFCYAVKKQNLCSCLEGYGFNNANVKPAVGVSLPVLVSLDNNFYLDTPTLSYAAKKGKGGWAKK
jgi:PKD repeat protein